MPARKPPPNSRIKPNAYVIGHMPDRAKGGRDYEYHRFTTVGGRTTAQTIRNANTAASAMNMFGPNAIMFEVAKTNSAGQVTAVTIWVQNGSKGAREIYFGPTVDTSFNYSNYGGRQSDNFPEGGPYGIHNYLDDEE